MLNLGGSIESNVSRIHDSSDIDFELPEGFSFFETYLPHFVKEVLAIGGEAYASRTPDGMISGLFIFDNFEKTGTIFTKSRKVFDYFYGLKETGFIFAELRTERNCETYDIYNIHLDNHLIDHSFSYEISTASVDEAEEVQQVIISAHPGTNKRWVSVALNYGEKCFMVRLKDQVAGLGWVSIVNRVGRLHSLFVKPQFRKMGIGEDLLYARLLWLKSKGARSAFSEISHDNVASSRIALNGRMQVVGEVFQYAKTSPRA